jgi:hypothetical protein
MTLDIRLPIGLMFAILGVILAAYGLLSDKSIYARSLGINVNLWWGIGLIVFGLVMIYFGNRRTRLDQFLTEVSSGIGGVAEDVEVSLSGRKGQHK